MALERIVKKIPGDQSRPVEEPVILSEDDFQLGRTVCEDPPMKPCGRGGFDSRLSALAGPLWRPLRGAALAILVLGVSVGASSAQVASTSMPHHHVYLLRGWMNLSPGLDEIAAKLRRHGINATVNNHLSWPLLADEAIADYKSGRARTIILVGHSFGAAAITSMAASLGEHGVPVKLAIGMDPVLPMTASGRVERYVNYYSFGAGIPIDKSQQFRGTLQNVNIPGLGHFAIDTNPAMQQKIIAAIYAALFTGHRATPKPDTPTEPSSAPISTSSPTQGAAASEGK